MPSNRRREFQRLLEKKRDSSELSPAEIRAVVDHYMDDIVGDCQMAAFLMAAFVNGLSIAETVALTKVMIDSGDVLSWEKGTPVVDKHSTGGIGDKVSLILAPMLACCGVRIPMLSGRGLGITGGTLDKLEAIRGFQTELTVDQIIQQVNTIGCVIAGTTSEIVPADRRLYTLRNFTSTVESPGLIASSILSKKAAEGISSLVVDVKFGSGSFMDSDESAQQLAKLLVTVGAEIGLKVHTIVSDMNQPLGTSVGNALEVIEAAELLDGQSENNVVDLACELGAKLLVSTGVSASPDDAKLALRSSVANGQARSKFDELVSAQGGSLDDVEIAESSDEVRAPESGVLQLDARLVGLAVQKLGAGRASPADVINHRVGVKILKLPDEKVEGNEPVLRIYHDGNLDENVAQTFRSAVVVN